MSAVINELALALPCPTCDAGRGDKCKTASGRESKGLHEARLAPVRAAYVTGYKDSAEETPAPGTALLPIRREPSKLRVAFGKVARGLRVVGDWFASEWPAMLAYLVAFAATLALYVFVTTRWPADVGAWGHVWRGGLVLSGGNLIALLVAEIIIRSTSPAERRSLDEPCEVCGAAIDEPCRDV